MANYSSWNNQFENCLGKHAQQPESCIPPPSSFNPYNITSLVDFSVEMLGEIISNSFFANKLGVCNDAVKILPSTFVDITTTIADPHQLNPPILSLQNLASMTFPFAPSKLNESSPAQIAAWWWNNVENDTAGSSNFIATVENQCTREFCTSVPSYGDPDISGIGMLVSTGMLIFMAVMFAIPAIFGWKLRRHDLSKEPNPSMDLSKGRRLRHALIGTLDDLFGAVIIFTLSVDIASLIIRYRTPPILFDIFMAETLSLISSIAMTMIATAYWVTYSRVKRLRLSVLVGFAINALLTIILFGIEFHNEGLEGIPLERNCLQIALGNGKWDNPGGRLWVLPLCFTFWLCTLLASLTQLPWVRSRTPKNVFFSNASYIAGLVPMVLGTISLVILCRMFYYSYVSMRTAFGTSFTEPENSWSFGQFLALATWVPPFLQFIHIIFAGMSNVLRTRLPEPWDVFIPRRKEEDQPQTV